MYGMLLESVQHFIQQRYGEEAWLSVIDQSGLRNVVFTTHVIYDDDSMTRIAHACEQVLGDKSCDQFMQFFGACFVQYFSHYGYDRMLRVCGRHFRDFLHGIDNIHETMRFSYPKMLSPSFYVTDEDESGCLLHYRSRRTGFHAYVQGQMQEYARRFYNLDLRIEVKDITYSDNGVHIVYRLYFDNSMFNSKQIKSSVGKDPYQKISAAFFFKVRTMNLATHYRIVYRYVRRTHKMALIITINLFAYRCFRSVLSLTQR